MEPIGYWVLSLKVAQVASDKQRKREKGGQKKKKTPRWNPWLINFPQQAAGRLAGSLCT